MSFLETWRLMISTLSPVHIGCGEDYDPTNYVIENDTLYEFEPGAALEVLSAPDREQLLKIVSGNASNEMLRQVQAFFYQRRQALIPVATRWLPVGPSLAAFYRSRVGKTVQVEGDGSRLVNKLEIERTFFNPVSGAPVLAGSSVKGAIRTALLDAVNDGQPLTDEESQLAKKGRVEANRKLQQRLFQYREFDQDPMRLVQVADACFLEEHGVGSEVRFAVNRRRRPLKPGELSAQSQAEQRGLYQILECVPAARYRAFSGQLTQQRVDGVADQRNRLPVEALRWDIGDIAAACNRFYLPIFRQELSQLRDRGFLDAAWGTAMETLLDGALARPLQDNQAFLLRVGRHSGAESVTLDGLRSIKILLGKDPQTNKQRSEYRATGTSWWLAAGEVQAQTGLLPFGWVLVERQPIDAAPQNWLELQEALGSLKTDYRVWIDREREQARQLAAAETQRQVAEQARQEEEAAAASLTAEQRALAELQRCFDNDQKDGRKEPGGPLANRINVLLKEGLEWPAADRAALARLAEAIYGYLGWGSGAKKRERKDKIQQLRQGLS